MTSATSLTEFMDENALVEAPAKEEQQKRLAKIFNRLRLVRALFPLLLWAYLVVALYLSVGILMFSAWWKRALYHGGLFEKDYLHFAFFYISQLIQAHHPLGLLFPGFGVFLLISLVYGAGKFGFRRFGSVVLIPSRATLWFFSVALVICVGSLAFLDADYRTPEEMQGELSRMRDQLDEPFTATLQSTVKMPVAGFFLYLDRERVGNCFNAVREALRVESVTTKSGKEASLHLTGGILDLALDGSGKLVQERATVQVPVTSTAERQALFLIEKLSNPKMRDAVLHLFDGTTIDRFDLGVLRNIIKDAGVTLTPEQDSQLLGAYDKKFLSRIKATKEVLFYSGSIGIQKEGTNLHLLCKSDLTLQIKCVGSLDEKYLESDIRKRLESTNSFFVSGDLLAVKWGREDKSNSVELLTVPLAVW
jgi:hypothetical protein